MLRAKPEYNPPKLCPEQFFISNAVSKVYSSTTKIAAIGYRCGFHFVSEEVL
jgi:hypothetical protein